MVMPAEPIGDIMRRTMANLAFIERHAQEHGPYEVTQLINSFLGALAHPWEEMKANLMDLSLTEAAQRGWPAVTKERPADSEPVSIGELVRLIRNAFAHGNITLLPSARGEIRALRVWNTDPRNKKRTWGAIISVSDARSFLVCFAELAEEIQERNLRGIPRIA